MDQDSKKRIIFLHPLNSQAPIKCEAGAGTAFPPLAGAHTCQGAALASPASSLQVECNQYLPTRCPEQSHRVKRKEKRVHLVAVLPAVPGGAASSPVLGHSVGSSVLCPRRTAQCKRRQQPVPGTGAHAEGSPKPQPAGRKANYIT